MGLIGTNTRDIELPWLSQVLNVPSNGAYIMYNPRAFFIGTADQFSDSMVCGMSPDALERTLRGAIRGSMVQSLRMWDILGPSQGRADIFSALDTFCKGVDTDYSRWGCVRLGSRAHPILELPISLTKFIDDMMYETFEGIVQGTPYGDRIIDCFQWVRLSKNWPHGDQRLQISIDPDGRLSASCNIYCNIEGEARGNIYRVYEKDMADRLCSEYILALLMFDVKRIGF